MRTRSKNLHGKCIYCPHTGALSGEHWLPRGFGKLEGFEQLTRRICEKCNKAIGDHELAFFRSGDAALFRSHVGIKGRKERDPLLPFKKPTKGMPPVLCSIVVDGIPFEVPVMPRFGSRDVDHVWSVVWVVAGKPVPTLIETGMGERELKVLLERELERIGRARIENRCFVTGSDEEQEVSRAVLGRMFKGFSTESKVDLPTGAGTVATTFYVSASYLRVTAKIAFHYVLKYCARVHGSEREFSPLRQFVRHGHGNPAHFVRVSRHQPIFNFERGSRPRFPSLVLAADLRPHEITVNVMYFLGPDSINNGFEVRLGRNPSRLFVPVQQFSHMVAYDPSVRPNYDGILREMELSRLAVPWQ